MAKIFALEELFYESPSTWGLRGDPYLWQEMKIVLGSQTSPEREEELLRLLEATYEELTGVSIKEQEPIYIKRFSHGGMSGGFVSPQFWVETGFPLLIERYKKMG